MPCHCPFAGHVRALLSDGGSLHDVSFGGVLSRRLLSVPHRVRRLSGVSPLPRSKCAAEVEDALKATTEAWEVWESATHPQEPEGSGRFDFDYSDNFQERVLILEVRRVRERR